MLVGVADDMLGRVETLSPEPVKISQNLREYKGGTRIILGQR